ncbi:inovirus Gp2 family protein [Vibrio parahaemolyticus]|nr:inovirus Gp2 family protein [Vibrio parahaemolyticus]
MNHQYTSEDKFNNYDLPQPTKRKQRFFYRKFHLYKISQLIEKALKYHPRLSVFRIDLHLPEDFDDADSKVITRFFKSLNAKLDVDIKRKEKSWGRGLKNKTSYIWAKEKNTSEQYHYHVALFLNKDIYYQLGDVGASDGSLADLIKQAWCSAIKQEKPALVHFCQNGVYRLNLKASDIEQSKNELFKRVCYFAKPNSKVYGGAMRNFATSS